MDGTAAGRQVLFRRRCHRACGRRSPGGGRQGGARGREARLSGVDGGVRGGGQDGKTLDTCPSYGVENDIRRNSRSVEPWITSPSEVPSPRCGESGAPAM